MRAGPRSPRRFTLALAATVGALSPIFCVACTKGDEAPAPAPPAKVAPSPPAPPSSSTAAAPTAAPRPVASASLGERLSCAKLFPDAALLPVAASFKVHQGTSPCPECGPQCNFVAGANPLDGASVVYTCNVKLDKARMDALTGPLKAELRKAKPVEGIGRGGIQGEKDNGTFYEVLVFDDDTDCSVVVDWMRGTPKNTLALARLAISAIHGNDVPPAP